MKRTLALILALVMTMALVACGGDKPTTSTTPGTSTPSNPTTSTPANPDKPAEPEKPVDPDAWKYGGDLIIGTSNGWTSFDPHQQSASSLGNTYMILHYAEGLVVKDANGKIYPLICDYEESADGCTIKFTLRERYFSNGQKITIEDVDASIRRSAALSTQTSFDKLWKGATYKVEGNTITITTESYNINLMSSLSSAATGYKVLPKEICDKYPVTGGTMQPCGLVSGGEAPNIDVIEDAIGSGPYKIATYMHEEMSMVRNENYQAIENDAIGIAKGAKCYLDSITWNLNKDASSRSAATMVGEYDIGSVTADMQATAETMGVVFADAGTSWTHGIFFNLSPENADSPIQNVYIRKAIRAIIDVDAVMLSIMSGNTKRIPEKLEPYAVVSTSEAYKSTKMEDSGEWNVKDKAKAMAYMAQANYDGTPIKYLTPGSGAFYNGAMAIIPMMESIGLKVELMVVDSGSHGAVRKDPAGGHDIGCWEVQKNEENPVLQSTFVTGTQGWWSSPAKEAAIATMKSTPTGSAESVAAYNDYLDAVIDECPYILFGHPIGQLAQRDNVVRDTVGQRNYYYWNTYFSENPRKK